MNLILSIIIPVYNKSPYIRKCLDSIIKSNILNIEVIVINDGSTDDSHKILKEYTKRFSQIVYIKSETNKGVSTARNIGLDKANGKYIIFIDIDDYVSSQYLSNIILHLQSSCDVYIWGITKLYPNNQTETITLPSYGTISQQQLNESFYIFQEKGLLGYVSNKAIKNSIIKKHNIRFNSQYTLAEDLDFYIQYYSYCTYLEIINESGYYYLQNPLDYSKDIDYKKLIEIHCHIHSFLAPSRSSQIKCEEYIVSLSFCSFTESKISSINQIEQLISWIYKNKHLIHWIKFYRLNTFLGYNIYHKNKHILYYYLKLRNYYIISSTFLNHYTKVIVKKIIILFNLLAYKNY